jgi:hypothetical protein
VIRPGEDGFLLDEFSAEVVVGLLESLTSERLVALSQAAFARQHDYSMEQYLASLEAIAAETARTFPGQNTLSPFPTIKAIRTLNDKLASARRRVTMLKSHISDLESSFSWRVTEPLRSLKAGLSKKPRR